MKQSYVTVYAFFVQGVDDEGIGLAKFKATRGDIETRYRGTVVEGTAEEVPVMDLDHERRFRRVATAWGELA